MVNNLNYLNELRNGNEEALGFIVDKYSNLIFKVAYSFLNRREVAKEYVNDILLKVWDNIENFNGEEKQFRNWICTISKYRAINMLRSEIKYSDNVELEENIKGNSEIEEELEQREELKQVMGIIDGLKEQDREIFYRRFILGQSLKDVSDRLGLKEKYIGQRISRCRKVIRNNLGNEELIVLILLTLGTFTKVVIM